MTKAEFIKAMEELKKTINDFDEQNNKLGGIFGLDATAENVFVELFYATNKMLIESLSILVGDESEWVDWYVYECDCGDKPMEAGYEGNKILCDGPEKLWKIIKS